MCYTCRRGANTRNQWCSFTILVSYVMSNGTSLIFYDRSIVRKNATRTTWPPLACKQCCCCNVYEEAISPCSPQIHPDYTLQKLSRSWYENISWCREICKHSVLSTLGNIFLCFPFTVTDWYAANMLTSRWCETPWSSCNTNVMRYWKYITENIWFCL